MDIKIDIHNSGTALFRRHHPLFSLSKRDRIRHVRNHKGDRFVKLAEVWTVIRFPFDIALEWRSSIRLVEDDYYKVIPKEDI